MPDEKVPATVTRRMRGTTPSGVALPSGAMSTSVSPRLAPSSAASAAPRMMRQLPGCRSSSRAPERRWPRPVAFASSAGSMPRTAVPSTRWPRASIACDSMKGTACRTPGCRSASVRAARQSAIDPSRPVSVACEVTDSMRERSSRSKPFITDSTTTSTATPSASPTTEIAATNDTKPRRCAERRCRVPTSHSQRVTKGGYS